MGGMEVVDQVRFESPIRRSPHTEMHGIQTRFSVPVPEHIFSDRNRYVQLWTYRTPDREGPAASSVLLLNMAVPGANDLFPGLALSASDMKSYSFRSSPFSYDEKDLSEGMFWGSLLKALPGIVKTVAPVVGSLFGGKKKPGNNNKAGGGGGKALLDSIMQVLQSISSEGGQKAEEAPPTSQASSMTYMGESSEAELSQFASYCVSKDTLDIIKDNPRQMGMVLNDSALRMGNYPRTHYNFSEGQVAPAAVAAVAPLVKGILELGLKGDAQHNKHLERLVELLNDPSLTALLASMSAPQKIRRFITDERVYIDTSALKKVELQNKLRVVYQQGETLCIPFKLASDHPNVPVRPIPRLIVQATIQDASQMVVLWEKEFRVKDVPFNSVLDVIKVLPEETKNLPVNEDLKLEITAYWQSKDGRNTYGTLKNQFITLVDQLVFNRFGQKEGDTLSLNDVVQHRAYWHKVWEGRLEDARRWHIEFNTRYYYAVDLKEDEPAHLDTKIKIVDRDNTSESSDRRKVRAKMKAGMELTLEMLNELLPENNRQALSEAQLDALRTPELGSYLNQMAEAQFEFKGRQDETASLWVYPEIDMHTVHLLRSDQVDKNGQVTEMSEEAVVFPRPSVLHFIGTKVE